jgi:hypothetical protein
VATTRFERDCLKEYAEVFKTVCMDPKYPDLMPAEVLMIQGVVKALIRRARE